MSKLNTLRAPLVLSLLLLLAACSSAQTRKSGVQDGPPTRHVDVRTIPNAIPKALPKSRYGNPASYVVLGKRYYVLKTAKNYNERGIASWYGTKFQGKLTSSREPYDLYGMTAASPTLPIPSFVRVTNLENGRSIIVKVNDRGPFAPNRIIDLSYAAAIKLGYMKKGTALVDVAAINIEHPEATPPTHIPVQTRLFLQIAAFGDYANAVRMRNRVAALTPRNVFIKRGYSNKSAIYRVQVGPLVDVDESDNLQQKLKSDGLGEAITVIG